MNEKRASWYCPLFGRDIAEGQCLDINYERLGYMHDECLKDVTKVTGKKEPEISETCERCPNMPLDPSSDRIIIPGQ